MTTRPPLHPRTPDPGTASAPSHDPETAIAPDPAHPPGSPGPSDPPPAPRAVGEIVPGEPPVPLTLWYLRAAAPGDAVSGPLARRLKTNYAHPHDPVLDLTTPDHPTTAPSEGSLALIITTWPQTHTTVEEHVAACATLLRPGGCAAIVVTSNDIPDQLGLIVTAARQAGLTYLQHLVVAHTLTARMPHAVARSRAHTPRRPRRHLRVHTDVLVVTRPRNSDA